MAEQLNDVLVRSASLPEFMRAYGRYVFDLWERLDPEAVSLFWQELERARLEACTVFVVGNGGSAATAAHLVNDLAFGTRQPLTPPRRMIDLVSNVAVTTAAANDVGFENVFVHQLKVQYRQGDVLMAISASGNSPNLLKAAEWVRRQGGKVLGLLGFDGGKMKSLCDVAVIARTLPGEYGPVEDIHMLLDHMFYTWAGRGRSGT